MATINDLKLKPNRVPEFPKIAAYRLTRREMDVLYLLMKGLSNKEIANDLNMKCPTVASNVQNIYKKFGIHKRTQLAIKILTEKLLA